MWLNHILISGRATIFAMHVVYDFYADAIHWDRHMLYTIFQEENQAG
jgi:hypothetical protein